jgi:two-component system copper resistance phosphate regulon response regulator CusR
MKILVVEDEQRMAEVLRRGLEEENHVVDLAYDGRSALSLVQGAQFDLVVLDLMLPGISGFQVARELRETGERLPILMLTARDSVPDIVKGLDSGADDYLTKPFSLAVLLARIRALERRATDSKIRNLRVSDLSIDMMQRRAFRGGREIHLTPTEFRLLEFLMRNQGRIATRAAILDAVWGPSENVEDNTLDAFVRLLRRKIDEKEPLKLIHTMRGFGYSLGPQS